MSFTAYFSTHVERATERRELRHMSDGGWMIEIFSSGLGARHSRYLVAIADRPKALAALHVLLGTQVHVSAVTRVSQADLDIAQVPPGKIQGLSLG